jgi:hypothetical protein
MMTEIMPTAYPGMIRMRMRDHSPFYRQPGVDVKVTCGTIDTFICELEYLHMNKLHNFHAQKKEGPKPLFPTYN